MLNRAVCFDDTDLQRHVQSDERIAFEFDPGRQAANPSSKVSLPRVILKRSGLATLPPIGSWPVDLRRPGPSPPSSSPRKNTRKKPPKKWPNKRTPRGYWARARRGHDAGAGCLAWRPGHGARGITTVLKVARVLGRNYPLVLLLVMIGALFYPPGSRRCGAG